MSDEGTPLKFEGDGGLRFRLPIYEGPLDLLLHLIKRAELDPQDVATSIITEQYLEQLNLMEQLNLDIAGEYLVMAATLLLIKSFALLPLDGGRVLAGLLPPTLARSFARMERYGFLILLVLLYTNTVNAVINPIINAMVRALL